MPAADTWVLLRSQRCVSANQPGPLAHWSMVTSRSSMSTRTTPLCRETGGSAPGGASPCPPPTQRGRVPSLPLGQATGEDTDVLGGLVLVHGLVGQREVSATSPEPRSGMFPLGAVSGGGWSWDEGSSSWV